MAEGERMSDPFADVPQEWLSSLEVVERTALVTECLRSSAYARATVEEEAARLVEGRVLARMSLADLAHLTSFDGFDLRAFVGYWEGTERSEEPNTQSVLATMLELSCFMLIQLDGASPDMRVRHGNKVTNPSDYKKWVQGFAKHFGLDLKAAIQQASSRMR